MYSEYNTNLKYLDKIDRMYYKTIEKKDYLDIISLFKREKRDKFDAAYHLLNLFSYYFCQEYYSFEELLTGSLAIQLCERQWMKEKHWYQYIKLLDESIMVGEKYRDKVSEEEIEREKENEFIENNITSFSLKFSQVRQELKEYIDRVNQFKESRQRIQEIVTMKNSTESLNALKIYIEYHKTTLTLYNTYDFDFLDWALEKEVHQDILQFIINQYPENETFNYGIEKESYQFNFGYSLNYLSDYRVKIYPPFYYVPLYTALAHGYRKIADELRKRGASFNFKPKAFVKRGLLPSYVQEKIITIDNLNYILQGGLGTLKDPTDLILFYFHNVSNNGHRLECIETILNYSIWTTGFIIKILYERKEGLFPFTSKAFKINNKYIECCIFVFNFFFFFFLKFR